MALIAGMVEGFNQSEELLLLKTKYEESEKNLKCLKKLAVAAVIDYEDLRRKYDQNQTQYEALKSKLKETEESLNNLQRVLEPACDQFNELSDRLTVERACRNEAELFAAQTHKQNKVLKRQSQMLLDKLASVKPSKDSQNTLEAIQDLEMDADSDLPQSPEGSADRKAFTDKIGLMEEHIKQLESRLEESEKHRLSAVEDKRKIEEKFKRLEDEFRKVYKQLQDRDQAMASIAFASERALGEFDDLKTKYETQLQLRQKAEELARRMFVDNESLKRTSTLLMDKDILSDARLMQALLQIEDLTKQLETLKIESKEKLVALEQSLSSDENLKKIEGMEIEMQLLNTEVARLQSCLAETEDWKEKLMKKNDELTGRLDEALRPPPPPPPPIAPPCPLLPYVTSSQKLVINKKSSSVSANRPEDSGEAAKQAPTMADAMQEMMVRITTGAPLTGSGRRPSVQQPAAVVKQDHMNELTQLLGKLKKRQAGDGSSNVSLKGVNKSAQPQSPSVTALQRLVSKDSQSDSVPVSNKSSGGSSVDIPLSPTTPLSPRSPESITNPVNRSVSRAGPPTAAKPLKSPVAGQPIRNRKSESSPPGTADTPQPPAE